MTDGQATRIEKLLRLQAVQSHNLLLQLTALATLLAPADIVSEPGFKATVSKVVNESKNLVLGVLNSLNEEIRKEGGSEPDDLAGRLKN
jgi:hypothetical protein